MLSCLVATLNTFWQCSVISPKPQDSFTRLCLDNSLPSGKTKSTNKAPVVLPINYGTNKRFEKKSLIRNDINNVTKCKTV